MQMIDRLPPVLTCVHHYAIAFAEAALLCDVCCYPEQMTEKVAFLKSRFVQ